MKKTETAMGYSSPECDVLDVIVEGVLCESTESGWGSTEDMDDLENIFGIK